MLLLYSRPFLCALATHILITNFYMHSASYRKLRQRDASKFQIQLCIALFFMLAVFVSGINRTTVYGVCVTVSVLIHYLTLVTWMWMGALAVHMYQKLVIVFVHISTRYIIAVSFVCWRKFQTITPFPVTIHHQILLPTNSVLCTLISFTAVAPIVPVVISLAIDRDFMVTYSPPTDRNTEHTIR